MIILSQVNRGVESRSGDKRPQLSDLRESGAIEADADLVMFIYRPEYYGMSDGGPDGNMPPDTAEIIIAKHRNGATGVVSVYFHPETMSFSNATTREVALHDYVR